MIPYDYVAVEQKLTDEDARYREAEQECMKIADDYERVLRELSTEDRYAVERFYELRMDMEGRAAQLLATYYAVQGATEFVKEDF